ncbi:helix-turn-helix domain-containing protein [Methylocapsa palsarum]|nr:helix-turn-helix domain-containing protein [Methylocapsa palsarum]
MTLAMLASRVTTRKFVVNPESHGVDVHKRRLFLSLTKAEEQPGVTNRALTVLHMLVNCRQETAPALSSYDASASIIVFASNKELPLRPSGIPLATSCLDITALGVAELAIRRKSANRNRVAPLLARPEEAHRRTSNRPKNVFKFLFAFAPCARMLRFLAVDDSAARMIFAA